MWIGKPVNLYRRPISVSRVANDKFPLYRGWIQELWACTKEPQMLARNFAPLIPVCIHLTAEEIILANYLRLEATERDLRLTHKQFKTVPKKTLWGMVLHLCSLH